MNVFECQGNVRVDVIMSINNSKFKPISEFKRSLEVLKVIEHLPSLALPSNMQLTPNAIEKYNEVFGAVIVQRNEYGVIQITPNHRLLSKMVMKSQGITHRSQLTNGIVTKANPLIGIPVPPFKTGKRLALVGGLEVKGKLAPVNKIKIAKLPDGVIGCSLEWALASRVMNRYGFYQAVSNGDKFSGVVDEYLVKGTLLKMDNIDCDLLLGEDSIKAVGCECDDNAHIQLLAEDRVSYNATLTYEYWCWHLDLLEKRIKNDMARPYKYKVIVDALDSESYQPASYDHPHNTSYYQEPTAHYVTREVPTLKLFLQGKAVNEAYASLHIWFSPEGQLMISEKAYKNALAKGCGYQEQLKMKNLIADMMSHKIRGAWGVANWNQEFGDDIISLPHNVWIELGRPNQVAVSRSPFIETIKLNVVTHFDGQDFRVSEAIMQLLAGDLDGDLILVAANKDIVDASPTFAQAQQLHRPFMGKVKDAFEWIKKQHAGFHLKDYNAHCNRYGLIHAIVRTDENGIEYCNYPDSVITDDEVDARYAQHYLAFECQMVPQASVIVTNMIAWGKLDKPTFIKTYRLLKQASLDQQDGGFPMFNLLISNFLNRGDKQSYISRISGIDDKVLKTFIPNVTPFIMSRNPVARYTAKGFCPSEIKTVLETAGKTKSPFSKMLKMFECLIDNHVGNEPTPNKITQAPDLGLEESLNMSDEEYNKVLGITSLEPLTGAVAAIEAYKDKMNDIGVDTKPIDEQSVAAITVKNVKDELIKQATNKPQYRIYTDGSKQGDGPITWAFAVIDPSDGIVHEASGILPMDTYNESRNIAGEVYAVAQALEWADANHHINITICHDYNGISKWACGEWQAKKAISHFLLHQLSLHKHINITWVKIKAHSGDVGNELVDLLAKQAAPPQKPRTGKCDNCGDIAWDIRMDEQINSTNKDKAHKAKRLIENGYEGQLCESCYPHLTSIFCS